MELMQVSKASRRWNLCLVLSLAKNFPSVKSGFNEPDFTFRLIDAVAKLNVSSIGMHCSKKAVYGSVTGKYKKGLNAPFIILPQNTD